MPNTKDNIARKIAKDRAALDTKVLRKGHQDRFLAKLEGMNDSEGLASIASENKRNNWGKWVAAASIILMIGFGLTTIMNYKEANLPEVPEEIANAEFYFEGLINADLEKLQSSKNEHTKQLIDDTISQINKLDQEYKALQKKLIEDYDRRIVKAMISNFQTRIDLLNMVLEQVEIIEQIKNEQQNENNYL